MGQQASMHENILCEKQENQIQTDNDTIDDNNVATNNIDREILCLSLILQMMSPQLKKESVKHAR